MFLHGHCSDLSFYASQRAMAAIRTWFQHSPRAQWPDGPRLCTQALRKVVRNLGSTWIEDGVSVSMAIGKFLNRLGRPLNLLISGVNAGAGEDLMPGLKDLAELRVLPVAVPSHLPLLCWIIGDPALEPLGGS